MSIKKKCMTETALQLVDDRDFSAVSACADCSAAGACAVWSAVTVCADCSAVGAFSKSQVLYSGNRLNVPVVLLFQSIVIRF